MIFDTGECSAAASIFCLTRLGLKLVVCHSESLTSSVLYKLCCQVVSERMDAVQQDVWQFRVAQQNSSVRKRSSWASSLRGSRIETVSWQETEEQMALQTAQVSNAMGRGTVGRGQLLKDIVVSVYLSNT